MRLDGLGDDTNYVGNYRAKGLSLCFVKFMIGFYLLVNVGPQNNQVMKQKGAFLFMAMGISTIVIEY